MKKAFKYGGVFVIGVVALFLIVVNFSAAESRFRCEGEISRDGSTEATTVFIRLAEYRWWVGLWSDSDGSLNLEVPNIWVDYFPHIDEVGDQLHIYDTYPQRTLKGSFSRLSRTLALDTGIGFFDGACSDTN